MAAAAAAAAAAVEVAAAAEVKSCDFCGESRALLYCRADTARLCLACDRLVHAANTVSSKHPRALLCDACCSNPSSFLCSTHNLLLCHNCDFDAHPNNKRSNSGSHHERCPIEPFSGCPSVVELMSALGVGEDEKSAGLVGYGWDRAGDEDFGWLDGGGSGDGLLWEDEGWVWETPPILSLDDLIVPTSSCHGFQAMGVPPLPKQNQNISCGKHKEEIIRQLRNMTLSETCMSNDFGELEQVTGFQPPALQHRLQLQNLGSGFEHEALPIIVPICESSALHLHNDHCEASVPVSFPAEPLPQNSKEENPSFVDCPTDIQGSRNHANTCDIEHGRPISSENMPLVLPKGGLELSVPDRDSVISRYKEKRKTRRYDKHIRYESRKSRADTRMRIKGRFAKVNQDAQS